MKYLNQSFHPELLIIIVNSFHDTIGIENYHITFPENNFFLLEAGLCKSTQGYAFYSQLLTFTRA